MSQLNFIEFVLRVPKQACIYKYRHKSNIYYSRYYNDKLPIEMKNVRLYSFHILSGEKLVDPCA